jgi:chitin deacetylase
MNHILIHVFSLKGSRTLYDFLGRENVTATHFFIGAHIQANPDLFLTAFSTLGDDIAVHTYTHPYLTSLSDDNVFAELAYTMQIIYNCTGGRVAKYWRPPYGDSDRRVQGIAKCLNLTTILWNHE